MEGPSGDAKGLLEAGSQRLDARLGEAARGAGEVTIGLARAGRASAYRVVSWASARAVAPNSVTAISLLLALCSAAWLSGGTAADNLRGLAAIGGWLAARVSARHLQAFVAQRQPRRAEAADERPGGSDWLILPAYNWSAGVPVPRAAAPTMPRFGERSYDWLFGVSTVAAECAIYGGMAAGGIAAGWSGTWPLAISTVVFVSVASIARTCAQAVAGPGGAGQAGPAAWLWNGIGALLAPPVGVRVLLAALIMVRYGPRLALVVVCVLEVISLSRTVATMATRRPVRAPHPGRTPADALRAVTSGQNVLLACRDDGPLARWAGRLVAGNLTPMPPALAGLVAVVLLVALGIKNLPGVIALTPVLVLLLAAPGAGHPHDGRLDWLVPVLICLGQYCYLAAFGLARGVPGPAVFATCSMTAVWYAGLAAAPPRNAGARTKVLTSRQARVRQIVLRPADGIGGEARICVVCLTAALGVATFGYLGLAAYLAALMCRKAVVGYLIGEEDQRP
ncbi:MAG TPA: hypothetical protein VMR14_22840 [Streptosporangiaceae bacterium]|nr:hypothetical protein [Streptosporangiaceae bacterium]